MDGVDVATSEIRNNSISVVYEKTFPYSPEISDKLKQVSLSVNRFSIDELATLDVEIGKHFAAAAERALKKHGRQSKQVLAIGSHGQTIKHSPNMPNPYSMQIGHGPTIAAKTGVTTITDFRSLDVAMGGQGAPLVPAFHEWCFAPISNERIMLNIGGIANITILSPSHDNPIGYDTGPGNCLMDEWAQIHLGKSYDENGSWAASGKVIPVLLEELLSNEYFEKQYPKSTGRESFNLELLAKEKTSGRGIKEKSPENIQATLLQFTAESIRASVEKTAADPDSPIYICGGGFYNKFLVKTLRQLFPNRKVDSTRSLGYSPAFLEAVAFSWLAYMRLSNLPVKLVTSEKVKYLPLGAIHA